MQKLEGATGVKFDQTYAKNMVKDHKKDLKEFQNAAKGLQDPELRNFAESAVPILQEHLTMAQNMETTVKSEK
jgi:putative membrane protein